MATLMMPIMNATLWKDVNETATLSSVDVDVNPASTGVLSACCILFILVFSVVGNSFAISAFIRDHRLRVTFNLLVMHLACADISLSLVVILTVIDDITQLSVLRSSTAICQACAVFVYALSVQQLIVTHFMCNDRHRALQRWLIYARHIPPGHKEKPMLLLTWFVSFTGSFLLLDVTRTIYAQENLQCRFPDRLLYVHYSSFFHGLLLVTLLLAVSCVACGFRQRRMKRPHFQRLMEHSDILSPILMYTSGSSHTTFTVAPQALIPRSPIDDFGHLEKKRSPCVFSQRSPKDSSARYPPPSVVLGSLAPGNGMENTCSPQSLWFYSHKALSPQSRRKMPSMAIRSHWVIIEDQEEEMSEKFVSQEYAEGGSKRLAVNFLAELNEQCDNYKMSMVSTQLKQPSSELDEEGRGSPREIRDAKPTSSAPVKRKSSIEKNETRKMVRIFHTGTKPFYEKDVHGDIRTLGDSESPSIQSSDYFPEDIFLASSSLSDEEPVDFSVPRFRPRTDSLYTLCSCLSILEESISQATENAKDLSLYSDESASIDEFEQSIKTSRDRRKERRMFTIEDGDEELSEPLPETKVKGKSESLNTLLSCFNISAAHGSIASVSPEQTVSDVEASSRVPALHPVGTRCSPENAPGKLNVNEHVQGALICPGETRPGYSSSFPTDGAGKDPVSSPDSSRKSLDKFNERSESQAEEVNLRCNRHKTPLNKALASEDQQNTGTMLHSQWSNATADDDTTNHNNRAGRYVKMNTSPSHKQNSRGGQANPGGTEDLQTQREDKRVHFLSHSANKNSGIGSDTASFPPECEIRRAVDDWLKFFGITGVENPYRGIEMKVGTLRGSERSADDSRDSFQNRERTDDHRVKALDDSKDSIPNRAWAPGNSIRERAGDNSQYSMTLVNKLELHVVPGQPPNHCQSEGDDPLDISHDIDTTKEDVTERSFAGQLGDTDNAEKSWDVLLHYANLSTRGQSTLSPSPDVGVRQACVKTLPNSWPVQSLSCGDLCDFEKEHESKEDTQNRCEASKLGINTPIKPSCHDSIRSGAYDTTSKASQLVINALSLEPEHTNCSEAAKFPLPLISEMVHSCNKASSHFWKDKLRYHPQNGTHDPTGQMKDPIIQGKRAAVETVLSNYNSEVKTIPSRALPLLQTTQSLNVLLSSATSRDCLESREAILVNRIEYDGKTNLATKSKSTTDLSPIIKTTDFVRAGTTAMRHAQETDHLHTFAGADVVSSLHDICSSTVTSMSMPGGNLDARHLINGTVSPLLCKYATKKEYFCVSLPAKKILESLNVSRRAFLVEIGIYQDLLCGILPLEKELLRFLDRAEYTECPICDQKKKEKNLYTQRSGWDSTNNTNMSTNPIRYRPDANAGEIMNVTAAEDVNSSRNVPQDSRKSAAGQNEQGKSIPLMVTLADGVGDKSQSENGSRTSVITSEEDIFTRSGGSRNQAGMTKRCTQFFHSKLVLEGFERLKSRDPELSILLSLMMLVSTQFVCWLPLVTLYMYYDVTGFPSAPSGQEIIFLWLWCARMAVQPFLYACYSKYFRQNYGQLLPCHHCKGF